MSVPPQTAEIFAHLSQGGFLSQNSPSPKLRDWFLTTAQFEAVLKAHFAQIGFQLVKGEGYFYLSRSLGKSALEEQLEKVATFIKWVDVLSRWQQDFGVGFQFSLADLVQDCERQRSLRNRLQKLSSRQSDSVAEQAKSFIRKLERANWLEETGPGREEYLVVSAFHYVEELLYRLQLSDS